MGLEEFTNNYKSINYILAVMPTWNCKNCDVLVTFVNYKMNVKCPNCNEKMVWVKTEP
jgi:predicted Zn-ribbon and HTH transcriptional regulator